MLFLDTLQYDPNNPTGKMPEMRKKCSNNSSLFKTKIQIPNTFPKFVFETEIWKTTIFLIKVDSVETHVQVKYTKIFVKHQVAKIQT